MAKIDNWTHKLFVYGMGSFPIDMLRYDRLCPASETDSGKIERSFYIHREHENVKEESPVCLMRIGHKTWEPTGGRWASFTWKIIKHEKTGPLYPG